MSIQESYFIMTNLQNQLALIELVELWTFAPYIACTKKQCMDQFFMPFCSDFEALHEAILHRNPLPFVDSVVSELLAKNIHFKSRVRKYILSTPPTFVFAIHSRPLFNNQNKPHSRFFVDECSYYKQKGHQKVQSLMIPLKIVQNQPSQQYQQSQFSTSQQHFYRSPRSNITIVIPPSDLFRFRATLFSNPIVVSLIEQFQKFLAIKPHAIFTLQLCQPLVFHNP